ncbi:MAG: hypothetical protein NC548_05415 [Lachnospiraceae bacterium]|nr:hypothetical protein [Lachnospiraceae bacterium]
MSSVFENLGNADADLLFPTGAGTNQQDENILIEVDGILHSECEKIFYGLEGCALIQALPFGVYRSLLEETPDKVYKELAFYRPMDLLTHLNDGKPLTEFQLRHALEYSEQNYSFDPSVRTNMNVAIGRLLKEKFVTSVAFYFDRIPTNYDMQYLADTMPNDELIQKSTVYRPEVPQWSEIEKVHEFCAFIKNQFLTHNKVFTTIITNKAEAIIEMLQHPDDYGCEKTFFLLRNHSGNMKTVLTSDNQIKFEEVFTDEIVNLINPNMDRLTQGFPLPLAAKFGRFSPLAFTDKPNLIRKEDQNA